jgi:hypothetical protein
MPILSIAILIAVWCDIGMSTICLSYYRSVTQKDYRHSLPALLSVVRKGAPGAKVVWGQTTLVQANLHALMKPHTEMHSGNVHFGKKGSANQRDEFVPHSVELLFGSGRFKKWPADSRHRALQQSGNEQRILPADPRAEANARS